MPKRRAFAFHFLCAAGALFAFIQPPGQIAADEVLLATGGKIQGDIISQDAQQVILQTAYGRVTFQTADIAKVIYSTPAEKELRVQLTGLAFSDVQGRLKLADAATAASLKELANSIYTQVIAIDADEKTARRALGYVMYEGEWVTSRDKEVHPGLVPYKARWVTPSEREVLRQNDAERAYFASFGLSVADGEALMNTISDIDLQIEPRGGYIVRRHVKTWPVKDKPYFYSTDLLTWQRLGIFIGVSFIDSTRHKTNGIGTLSYTVYSVKTDVLGNNKIDREIVAATVNLTPDMWSRESDFRYWDTKINSTYEKVVSDDARAAWSDNYYMNNGGAMFVLANRDIAVLAPPAVFYVEATFTLKGRVKKAGRFVQYAELR